MGHEFCGHIQSVGDDVQRLKVGDLVVSPFTISCGVCFYCRNGLSSRCDAVLLYGSSNLPGAQAQYVRVPLADSTLVVAPKSLRPSLLLVMADILPTGYYATTSALSMLPPTIKPSEATVVVVGCGPVGLCAVVTAASYSPQNLFAVDSVPDRLEQASVLGAQSLDLRASSEKLVSTVKAASDGRGADVVVELVGQRPAIRLAFDLLRPGGVLVSMGVHHESFPWTLSEGKPLFHHLSLFATAMCASSAWVPC